MIRFEPVQGLLSVSQKKQSECAVPNAVSHTGGGESLHLRGMRGCVAHLPRDNIRSHSASLVCLFKGAAVHTVSPRDVMVAQNQLVTGGNSQNGRE